MTGTTGTPKVYNNFYFQGGKKFCVTFSVASVLRSLGLKRQAEDLVRKSEDVLNDSWNTWEASKELIMQKGMTIKNAKINCISDIDVNKITVLCLCAVHSKHYTKIQYRDSTHVVSAYKNKRFDANRHYPLKLTIRNLHRCCVGDHYCFHHFSRSFTIEFSARLENIIKKKLSQCN